MPMGKYLATTHHQDLCSTFQKIVTLEQIDEGRAAYI